jgi:hypothetical protein
LVPFVAAPAVPFDAKLHQPSDPNTDPAADALVAETVATGYMFQGQLLRKAVVTLQSPDASATDASPPPPAPEPEAPETMPVDSGQDLPGV